MLVDIPEEDMDLIYVSGIQSDGMGRLCHYVLKNQHKYCKLVIIRHVPIFAIFVSALNDEFTYWRI